jgi:hypothetical protein
MNPIPRSVPELISKWPSAEIFADELGLKWRSHGRVMKYRGKIPRTYWPRIAELAAARGMPYVNETLLERLHDRSAS